MKTLSQLVARTEISLFCHHCEKILDHKIVDVSKNGVKIRCKKCTSEMVFSGDNYMQVESGAPINYSTAEDFKIGQKLHHKIFDDQGDIVGKIRNTIYVNFEKGGVKKLVCSYK